MTRNIFSKIVISLLVIVAVLCLPSVSRAQMGESGQSVYREQRSREGYTLNLRDLITESRNKISKVDDELKEQARRRRNQQREEKAREYFDKAMRLYEEQNFEEAQVYWERAIKITEHPEMKDYVRESVKREKAKEAALQKEQNRRLQRLEVERGFSAGEVEAAYQEAVKLFKQKNYVAALEAFESVDNMFPDHKGTRSYLMLIHQEIQKEQAKIIEQKLQYDAEAQRKEKEIWRRKLKAEDDARQQLQNEKAGALYAQAVSLYKKGDFVAAKAKFQDVEWLIPDFRSTVWYLTRIDRNIGTQNIQIRREDEQLLKERNFSAKEIDAARQQMTPEERNQKVNLERENNRLKRIEEEADFVYRGALKLYEQGDFDGAYTRFQEVQHLSAGYKNTAEYLSRLESRERALQSEALYQKALVFYKEKSYEDAKIVLEELKQVWPGYRAMNRYLAKVDRQIARGRGARPSGGDVSAGRSPIGEAVARSEEVNTIVQGIVEERSRRFQEEAEDKYSLALDFYQKANYIEAKIRFIQVEALIPGYKETHDYLSRIDEDIAAQRRTRDQTHGSPQLTKAIPPLIVPRDAGQGDDSLRNDYRQAVDLYRQKDFQAAKELFLRVQGKSPEHRGAKKYLVKIDRQLARLEKKRQKIAEEAKDLALAEFQSGSESMESDDVASEPVVVQVVSSAKNDSVLPDVNEVQYQDAVADYERGRYEDAQKKFSQLSAQEPGYRATEWYLGCIDQKLLELETGLSEAQCLIQDKNFRAAEKRLEFLAGRYPFLTKTGTFANQADSMSVKPVSDKLKKKSAARAAVLKRKQERIDERNRLRAEKQLVHSRKVEENQKPLNWEKRRDQKYAEFKAKEAHLANLKGDRYRAFRQQLEEERRQFEAVERARQRMIRREQKNTRDRLQAEENARRREEKEQAQWAAKAARMEEKAVWESEQLALQEHQEAKKAEVEKIRDEQKTMETQKQVLEAVQTQTQNDFQSELDALRAKIDDIQNRFDQKMALKNQEIEELKKLIDAKASDQAAAGSLRDEQSRRSLEVANAATVDSDPAVKLSAIQEQVKWQSENGRQQALRKLSQVQREQRQLELRKENDLRRQREEVKAYLARMDADQRARIRREVAAIYQEGLDLYDDGRVLAARIKFNAVENLYPGYRGAQTYIARIDKVIAQEKEDYTKDLVAKTVAEEKAQWQQKDEDARLGPYKEKAERQAKIEAKNQLAALKKEEARVRQTEADRSLAVAKKEDARAKREAKPKRSVLKEEEGSGQVDSQAESRIAEPSRFLESSEVQRDSGEIPLASTKERAVESSGDIAKEDPKQARQQLLAQRQRQKEAEKLAKQQEREEINRRRQRQDQLRAQIDRVYDEALNLYANGHVPMANEKFREYDRLLMGGGFPESYVRSARARLGKEKEKIDRRSAQRAMDEKRLAEQFARDSLPVQTVETAAVRGDRPTSDPVRKMDVASQSAVSTGSVSVNVPEDLKVLNQKIQADEQRLSKQRAVQDRQVREMKEREAELARREIMREQLRQQRLEREVLKDEEMLRLEQAKRERIEMLERQRQESASVTAVARIDEPPAKGAVTTAVKTPEGASVPAPAVSSARQPEAVRSRLDEIDRQRRANVSDEQLVLEQKLRLEETDRMTRNERRALEKKRREELQLTLKNRQDEIQRERQKIQQEFARNIDRLYGKAVGLFKSGDERAAHGLFQEIDRLKPSYKRTRRYLEQLDEKFPQGRSSSQMSSAAATAIEVTTAQQSTSPVSPRLSLIQQALDQLESR